MNTIFSKNFIILVGILIIAAGCDKELSEIDENKVLKKLSLQELELINSTNSISIDILKTEYEINKEENFVFSPVSVGLALGMIYNGVGEKEKMQIQRFMGLESLVEKEINKSYNELLSFLQVSNDHLNISYANSIWFSNDIHINEDYRTRVMAYYDAEISELNLRKQSSLDFINSWGNLKTNGSFDVLLKEAPAATTEIFLVNAFSLNTEWDNTLFLAKRTFTNAEGKTLDVNTLNWEGLQIKLNSTSDYSFIEIPFENDQFKLSVIQSAQNGSLDQILESFTSDDLLDITKNSLEFKANVSLPAINFDGNNTLKNTLVNVGLNDLFLASADLSPSFADPNNQISDIRHLARITMNTPVGNAERTGSDFDSAFESIYVNKPFLYFVKDKHTKSVLFAGFYSNPE